jgi:hypothetical protein
MSRALDGTAEMGGVQSDRFRRRRGETGRSFVGEVLAGNGIAGLDDG